MILLSVYARPFISKSPAASVLVTAVAAIIVQYTLLELWLVPELATTWKEIETNGTALDQTLADVTGRLSDLETLINITI